MSFFNLTGFHNPLIFPSPSSPFCTSPSQLLEVTDQDATFSNSMGLRSPGGPMRGRSVKEFEEQLANLKKENFNLKLRIYFLEERMGPNFNLDKENVVKKNVELMVEVESLRKELEEKHDLLCQAVKAMELEDDEHKKLLGEKEDMLVEYNHEIESLKIQLLDLKTESEHLMTKNYHSDAVELLSPQINLRDNATIVRDLQEKIKSLEDELNQEKENNAAIQLILDQTDVKVRNMTLELEEANKKFVDREFDVKSVHIELEDTKSKYQLMHKRLQEQKQETEEMSSSNEELRKRQAVLIAELEKERKRSEKVKHNSDQKIAELQYKVEESTAELKKSQELVVSKSPAGCPGITDPDSFLVQKSATSPGSSQKDLFLLPTVPSPVVTPTPSPSPSVNFNPDNAMEIKHVIEQLRAERDAQHQKIVKLKAEQMKACKIIKSMIDSRNKTNNDITMLKQRNEELERELEGVVSKMRAESDRSEGSNSTVRSLPNENSMDERSGELLEHYKTLTDELEEKNRILIATLKEKDVQMRCIQEEYDEILKDIKEKEEHIVDLEFELLSCQDKSKINVDDSVRNIDFYNKQLKEKDEEIKRLNSKLLKRNCDLQGLVNNELWEKNREIEKLQKKQVSRVIENKNYEIEKLQNDLQTKEKQYNVIIEKISELGIGIEVQNGDVNVDRNLQNELEKSEQLRAETNEVCVVLSQRLEELAIFLDSLLKQKCILGFLGQKENKRLRQIIDQSLDLSRSFTMSMMINPEQSLMQLTSISSVLNDTDAQAEGDGQLSVPPATVTLTYCSQLFKKDEDNSNIIQTLREQIVNLKYELRLRDVELSKINSDPNLIHGSSEKQDDDDDDGTQKFNLNTTSTTLKYKSGNQSESESWSEPDRSVSRARIGLVENSLKLNFSRKSTSNASTDSAEEDGITNTRVSAKKGAINDCRNTVIELHTQVCELHQKLNDKEVAYYEATKTSNKLKQELSNSEAKLKDAEKRKIAAEEKAEQFQKEKSALLEILGAKDKEMQNKINEIEVEKMHALSVAKEAERIAEIAKGEMKAAELKIRDMQDEMDRVEEHFDNQLMEKMQSLEEESLSKIQQIRNGAELEIKILHDTIQQLQYEYSANYVKKCQLEEAADEIERLKNDMESLEERMEELVDEKDVIMKKLADREERVNGLRNDLDNATLQYSEAVLEKTKIANEKAVMEQELSRSVLDEIDTKKRLDEVETELIGLKQSHQKQMSALQLHKSELEVRVSELESANAELHNRLIRIQAGCGDNLSSPALINTPNFVNQIVSFRRQHSENSGYLSEDHALLDDLRLTTARTYNRLETNSNIDIERNDANSSPDLGIESDHGRFSSLETHLNVQRPLLQTLELTESMNNLLDVENSHLQEVECDDAHCCQRTLEMAHENTDLKRKLLRTRRALEETVTQLTLANQRKKQVEKTICKQIHKTSQVLRKAKANLHSGSETDMYKK